VAGISLPRFSDYDPAASAEGSIDPLGLYAIADSLALQLIPGIRERMIHPRFLTAMAAGNVVTRDFDEDMLAADGQTEPYLVYEWHVVEGLVRTRGKEESFGGIPGTLKVKNSIRQNLPLSAARYLKNAGTFGFHGVYRVLAKNLDIVTDGILGETGYELLKEWEDEQDLNGFLSGSNGNGHHRYRQIRTAVEKAISKGAVAKSPAWGGWSFFGDHLYPRQIGTREAEIIIRALVSDQESTRSQVIRFLASRDGHQILSGSKSERRFHEALRPHMDEAGKNLLDAISYYEKFSRYIQDAFNDCLHVMTKQKGKTSLSALAKEATCLSASENVPMLFQEVADRLEPFKESARFLNTFNAFSEHGDTGDWIEILLNHHITVQRRKPPNGRNSWFERFDDGTYIVRTAYTRNEPAKRDDSYVNAYRSGPLYSFLYDLGYLEE